MLLSVRGVSKSFEAHGRSLAVLREISFDVPTGEVFAIVGPSGCGKSTLLRLIAGIDQPESGSIEVTGEQRARAVFSMVFQSDALLPWRSVSSNVDLPGEFRHDERPLLRRVTDAVLARVGMLDFRGFLPMQLSGGMKQRTAIGRALAHDPEILLMDEPFAHLDAISRAGMQDDLLRLVEGSNKSMLYVTHSIDEAVQMADRVAVLTRRPGRIRAIVPVPVRRPRSADSLQAAAAQLAVHQIWDLLRADAEAISRGA